MNSAKDGAQKHKNHAQDCGTLKSNQRPAILPWFSYFGWRPSFSGAGILPVTFSGRIAAETHCIVQA
jgi:hypothetical protein